MQMPWEYRARGVKNLLTVAETAEALNIKTSTVRAWLFKVRLRDCPKDLHICGMCEPLLVQTARKQRLASFCIARGYLWMTD